MALIVKPPCNLAGRQAQVCRGRAGHPARAGSAAGPQSRTSEAPPDGRALGKGPGAAAGALFISRREKAHAFSRGRATRDVTAGALRRERGLASAPRIGSPPKTNFWNVSYAVSQSRRGGLPCLTFGSLRGE